MASRLLENAVSEGDNGWDFHCPVNDGTCGDENASFSSTGWPTKKAATARGQEHFNDHKGIAPMTPLDEFRESQGLVAVQNDDGTVTVTAKDL